MADPPDARLDVRLMMADLESRLFSNAERLEISRFEVGRRLGGGAMGVVYEAHDPELDRRLAIKVLRQRIHDEASARRFAREAEAMAAVAHPNVLTVYESGLFDGQPYIAMELVDGGTLAQWQAAPRSVDEILAIYIDVGEGLHAAHTVGLVHRDFKPANVLVGRDSRPRVADFGLVRFGASTGESHAGVAANSIARGRARSASITSTGATVGTPAYMSPEQHDGASATAASDQFSFCVALYEALYRELPFPGRTAAEVGASIRAGTLRSSTAPGVRARVRRALVTGLSLDPRHRHASMRSLVDRLRRSRTRRGPLVLGATAAGLVVVSVAMRSDARTCDAERRVDTVWNDAIRESIAVRFATEGEPAAWGRIEAAVDDYLAEWTEAYREACAAAGGEQLDVAMRCLDRRLEAVSTVVDVVHGAAPDAVSRISTSELLAPIENCRDPEYLRTRGRHSSDAELDREHAAAQSELVRARTLYQMGRFADAIASARELERTVEGIGDESLLAEVSLLLGIALERNAEYGDAEATLTRAYTLARSVGEDGVAMSAATRLIHVFSDRDGALEEGDRWVQHAQSLDVDDPALQFEFRGARAALELEHRRPAEALALYEENLHRYAQVYGDDTIHLGPLQSNIGVALLALSREREALEHLTKAMELHERQLGPDHPELAVALGNIALAHEDLDEFDAGLAALERALSIRRKSFGKQHGRVAAVLVTMSRLERKRGDPDRAIAIGKEALAMVEETSGPTDPKTATTMAELAEIYIGSKRFAEARPLLERALVIQTEALGANAIDRAFTLHTLSTVQLALGEYAAAEALEVEALDIATRNDGPRSSRASSCHHTLALIHVAQGNLEEALEHHRIDLSILTELDAPWMGADLNAFGDALRDVGRHAEALAVHRDAVELNVRSRSPTHPFVAYSEFRVGLALEGLGRLHEASDAFEHAMTLREREDGRRFLAELPEARLALARVRQAVGDQRRARELAAAAIADYGEDPRYDAARDDARRFAASLRR